jgi:hypothetical protein
MRICLNENSPERRKTKKNLICVFMHKKLYLVFLLSVEVKIFRARPFQWPQNGMLETLGTEGTSTTSGPNNIRNASISMNAENNRDPSHNRDANYSMDSNKSRNARETSEAKTK